MRMNKLSAVITLTVSVLVFILGANLGKVKDSSAASVISGSTVSVEDGDVTKIISASGQVVNFSNVYWSPPSIEPVKTIQVKVGDIVHVGTILATLRDDAERIAYENAKVALDADQIALFNADNAIATLRNNQLAQLHAAQITLTNVSQNLKLNAPLYQATVDQALNNLNTATLEFDAKEITYDATLQNSLNNLNSARRAAFAWINAVGDTGTVNSIMATSNPINSGGCALFGLSGPACTPNALAGDYKDYNTAQNDYVNAISSYNSAKQTREINRQNDNQQLANLKITYSNSIAQQAANTARDNQAVANAQAQVNIVNTQLSAQPNQVLRSKVAADKVAVSTAFNRLSDTVVKSPIEGSVAAISNTIGQTPTPIVYSSAGAGTGMFTLRSKSPDTFKAQMNSIDGAKVRIGQAVSMSITMSMPQSTQTGGLSAASSLLSGLAGGAASAAAGATAGAATSAQSTSIATNLYSGTVMGISPAPSAFGVTPGYNVFISFNVPPSDVFPGLPGNVSIAVKAVSNVLIVPNTAIKQIGGYYYVQKVIFHEGKNVAYQARVTLGVTGTNSSEVTAGLKLGDMVNTAFK